MTHCLIARSGRFPVLLVVAGLLAGCMSVEAPVSPRPAGQPRLATYACGDGSSLRIEASGGMVLATLVPAAEAKGDAAPPEPVDLPAAPPGQSTRFGKEGYALVIEGREALYMKAGRVPLTCTR